MRKIRLTGCHQMLRKMCWRKMVGREKSPTSAQKLRFKTTRVWAPNDVGTTAVERPLCETTSREGAGLKKAPPLVVPKTASSGSQL